MMDTIKIAAIVFGATGFWKLIDSLIKWRGDRKLKNAEASNFYAQANREIVNNWVQWSQKLEEQVEEMKETVSRQRDRIDELEKLVEKLGRRNSELECELNKLKNGQSG